MHGNVEECYSTGTVFSTSAASVFAFSIKEDSIVKNCYSSSTVILDDKTKIGVGATVVNYGKLLNYYYSGKIVGTTTQSRATIGALISINNGTVRNCHWLYYEDSLAQQAICRGHGTSEDIYSYTDISDMYSIADLLNEGTEGVWINVDSDTPKFKSNQ